MPSISVAVRATTSPMLELRDVGLGVQEVRAPRYSDERGFFSEVWNAAAWAAPVSERRGLTADPHPRDWFLAGGAGTQEG